VKDKITIVSFFICVAAFLVYAVAKTQGWL
jgi:hypothetical protein